jgi:hypothetical protein
MAWLAGGLAGWLGWPCQSGSPGTYLSKPKVFLCFQDKSLKSIRFLMFSIVFSSIFEGRL